MDTDFNELIFRNRNKEYGAYLLRKNYKKHITISLLLSVLCCSSIVVIPFLITQVRIYKDGNPGGLKYVELTQDHLEAPKEILSSKKYTEMMTRKPLIVEEKMSADLIGDGESNEIYKYEVTSSISGHSVLESRPSFQGGDIMTFANWVAGHIVYPEEARKNSIQGTFKILFVVEKDGSLSNVKMEPTAERSIEREIKKVIATSPKWTPGTIKGKAVRVLCEIPISFTIR